MEKQCYAVMKRLIEEHEQRSLGACPEKSRRSAFLWSDFEESFLMEKISEVIYDVAGKTGRSYGDVKDRVVQKLYYGK